MMDTWDMPEWRREDGTLMIWDPTSHSYVEGPEEGGDLAVDRGHASGGDNDLFDPASDDGHMFQPSNPDNNGWLDGKTSSVQAPAMGERFQMLHVGDYASGLEGYGQSPTDEYWIDIVITRVNDDGVLFEDTQTQMPEFKLWFEWQEDIDNGAIRPFDRLAKTAGGTWDTSLWQAGDVVEVQADDSHTFKLTLVSREGLGVWIARDPYNGFEYDIDVDGDVFEPETAGNAGEWVGRVSFIGHDFDIDSPYLLPENRPNLPDDQPGDLIFPEHWAKVAETVAPSIPDINYVLDYNPEDQQETGWYARIWSPNYVDGANRNIGGKSNKQYKDIHPTGIWSETFGTWQQCADFLREKWQYQPLLQRLAVTPPDEPFEFEWNGEPNPVPPDIDFMFPVVAQISPLESKTSKIAMPYHVSPRGNREEIEQEGLQDTAGHGGVFYWDTPEQAKAYWDWLEGDNLDMFGHGFGPADVWGWEHTDDEQDRAQPDDPLHHDMWQYFRPDRDPEGKQMMDEFHNPPWDEADPETAQFGAWFLPGQGITPDRLKRVAMPYQVHQSQQWMGPLRP